jgi:hypothetical protein
VSDTSGRRFSRRQFFATAGAGALAAGTGGRVVVGDAHGASATPGAVSRSDRFGRMFPDLPAFANASDRLLHALMELGAKDGPIDARDDVRMDAGAPGPLWLIVNPGRNEDSTIPAGMTFLGQFVDHDVTFDETSPLGVPTAPETSPNSRQPTLNLDSVYGGGFGDSALVRSDGSMRIEQCDPSDPGSREDLPRMADGTAVIADRRNDENTMIAGLHAAVLRFHNRALDLVTEGDNPAARYAEARRLTTWHYQWIVLNEFLPAIVGQKRVDQIRRSGRRFYRPSGEPFIPVEFQIAYRLHTLARPSYRLNFTSGTAGGPLFLFLFHPSQNGVSDPDDLRGGHRSPRRFVDWQTFFSFPGFESAMRTTKKLDRLLSTPLFTLPLGAIATGDPPTVLAQRNLLRHVTWELPSGQAIAKVVGDKPLSSAELAELRAFGHGLDRSTPLWHYVNAEAELLEDGERLGPVGGRIVAEVLIGLLELDPVSFLSQSGWRPTLPAPFSGSGEFRMIDFLAFAGVDPASLAA